MFLVLLPVATMLAQPSETALEGSWRNPSGSVIISIAPCGEAMCGRVEWASDKAVADVFQIQLTHKRNVMPPTRDYITDYDRKVVKVSHSKGPVRDPIPPERHLEGAMPTR